MKGKHVSVKYPDVAKRMQLSKGKYSDLLVAFSKRNAVALIKNFRDGIVKNALGLKPLAASTIASKKSGGSPSPSTPLYRTPGDSPKLYRNMLRLRKVKDGWKVYPSKAKHEDAEITLDHLLAIHEYGCTIVVGKKSKNPRVIKIPPRPAYKKALEKTIAEKKKLVGAEYAKALNSLIYDVRQTYAKRVMAQIEADAKKYARFIE